MSNDDREACIPLERLRALGIDPDTFRVDELHCHHSTELFELIQKFGRVAADARDIAERFEASFANIRKTKDHG